MFYKYPVGYSNPNETTDQTFLVHSEAENSMRKLNYSNKIRKIRDWSYNYISSYYKSNWEYENLTLL